MKLYAPTLDLGLSGLQTNASTFYLCSQEPLTLSDVTTFALGNHVYGAGNAFSPLGPNDVFVTSVASVDSVAVTTPGTATWLAVVDATRLWLTAPLLNVLALTLSEPLWFGPFTITIANSSAIPGQIDLRTGYVQPMLG